MPAQAAICECFKALPDALFGYPNPKNILIWLAAFFLYFWIVFAIKKCLYPIKDEPLRPFPTGWETGYEYTTVLSPDFWWAIRFKNRIKQFPHARHRRQCLKSYVQRNNKWNLWISFALTACTFIAYCASNHPSLIYLGVVSMAVIRFFSRSFEITYAFARDIFQLGNTASGLTRLERINLALKSYLEIYIYSAGAYLALPSANGIQEAIVTSLNVGTLTNVGFAFPADRSEIFSNSMVFIQVITTLSLVVLSLAAYLSRKK